MKRGEPNRLIRWLAAGLFTVAIFSGSAVICGMLVLPSLLRSSADRWVVASGVGVAVAALTTLWGASWAMREPPGHAAEQDRVPGRDPSMVVTADRRGIAIGGDNHGVTSTGGNSATTRG